MTLQYFRPQEVTGLDEGLCVMLDRARGLAGVPFIITCGLRTPEQNANLPHAVCDSAHLTGHAVDLHCPDDATRFRMMRGLLQAGFTRVGEYVADGHIHVDNDATKPPNVIWLCA